MLIKDPQLISKIANWREKCNNGTITLQELREAVTQIREGRVSSTEASRTVKAKVRGKPAKSGEELMMEIENL